MTKETRSPFDFLAQAQVKRFVQPVVVFSGWSVDKFDMKALGVWVLEPKAPEAFIDNPPHALSPEEGRAMASALSSDIRSQSTL